ncbi:hypothetical protein ILYODFUR_021994 [Ilyodon furcidens]|uniref:Uncharacterized protein n=1 Tax=Ilyodon furcidens TaxID=33524 RepID=A0ABV0UKD5_9TELE
MLNYFDIPSDYSHIEGGISFILDGQLCLFNKPKLPIKNLKSCHSRTKNKTKRNMQEKKPMYKLTSIQTNKHTNKITNQPKNQTTTLLSQYTNQMTDKSIEQPTKRPINQQANQPLIN